MRFEIKGKEYNLKLTYDAIVEINKKYKAGAQEVVSSAILGDISMFEDAIYFGLLHTEQGFTQKDIKEALNALFEAGKLTQEFIKDVLKEVITDHFFYQATAQKMKLQMKKKMAEQNLENPEMVDELIG